MATTQLDAVREIAGAAVGDAGLVLETLTISSAGRRRVVKVVVDLPETASGGVPMDAVADASQRISQALDAHDVLGSAPYTLEVTSPGAERALTERRHFARSRGRLVRLDVNGQEPLDGRLLEVDDDGVVVAPDAGGAEQRFGWDAVRGGRVRLDFSGGQEDR